MYECSVLLESIRGTQLQKFYFLLQIFSRAQQKGPLLTLLCQNKVCNLRENHEYLTQIIEMMYTERVILWFSRYF